eukprot:1278133-Pyramimonas_sp.AAC.1
MASEASAEQSCIALVARAPGRGTLRVQRRLEARERQARIFRPVNDLVALQEMAQHAVCRGFDVEPVLDRHAPVGGANFRRKFAADHAEPKP